MEIRKIISKKDEGRRNKRNQLILGIIMILVMFFSVVGYSFSAKEKDGENEKVNYKGFEFIKELGLWNINLNNLKFSFKYNPNEVEEVNSKINLLDIYSGKPLYFSSGGAEAEIARNLFYQNKIAQRIQYACLEGEECVADYPIKTCEDNFIIIRERQISEIKQQQNCLFIQGEKEELTKLADSVLFKIIGIQ